MSTNNSWAGKQNGHWHSYMFRNEIFIPTIQLECLVLARLLSETFPSTLCQYHNHKVCSKFYSSKIEDSLGVIIPCRKDSLERDSIFACSVRMGGLGIIFGGVLGRTLKSGICIFNIERLILWCLCKHTFMFPTVTSCADTLLSSLPQKKTTTNTDSQLAEHLILHTSFSFGHKLRNQLQERIQNTTNPDEPVQPKWKSRNNVHLRSIHPHDNLVTARHNKAFGPASWIKFIQDILVARPHLILHTSRIWEGDERCILSCVYYTHIVGSLTPNLCKLIGTWTQKCTYWGIYAGKASFLFI